MTPLLLLFDIDGTLLHTGGSGMAAFKKASEHVLKQAIRFRKEDFAGKVDRLIFKGLYDRLAPAGLSWEAAWNGFKGLYLSCLAGIASDPSDWIVFPGVREFLEKQGKAHCLGLLTGNIREGARTKLSAVGLWECFECGGFGEDGDSREKVAEAALARARACFQGRFSGVWVVGDTVHDIRCGRHIGAKTLGVRTGFSKKGELEAAGADRVVDNLEGLSL